MALQALGEELYPMVEDLYPELAPRLTGMLLQLGEIECRACIDDQNKLAERLGEALEILESGSSDQPVGRNHSSNPGETRIDPEDAKAKTLQQLRTQYKGQYTASEIDEFWQTCKPARTDSVPQPKATNRNGTEAQTKPKPKSAPTSKSAPVLAKASGAPKASATAKRQNVISEPVKGLSAWLNELDLSSYFKAAAEWVEEQGAVRLEELVENLEDFADDMKLTGAERKRLEDGAEDAIAASRAATTQVVDEEPSGDPDELVEDDHNEGRSQELGVERDFADVDNSEKDSSPPRRWPKAAPSQDAPKAKVASKPKQESLPSAAKGKGKQSAEMQEKRVDPSDGIARTLSELRELYAGEYSPQEINEYWEDCRPIGAPESEPITSSPNSSATRSGFGSVTTAPRPGATASNPRPSGQVPKAKAGGYWGAGQSKMRF